MDDALSGEKASLPADLQAKVDTLKSRVIPDSPPYDQWFKPGHQTLEVRQYAHPDCWKFGSDPTAMSIAETRLRPP